MGITPILQNQKTKKRQLNRNPVCRRERTGKEKGNKHIFRGCIGVRMWIHFLHSLLTTNVEVVGGPKSAGPIKQATVLYKLVSFEAE